MQVAIGNLFESIVYHVHVEEGQVFFLIWDVINQKFDLVDADMCRPLNIAMQDLSVTKKIAAKKQKEKDIEVFKHDAEALRAAEERRKRKSKE